MDRAAVLVGYYHWARVQWSEELSAGLARIRSVQGAAAEANLILLERMSAARRTRLVEALLARFHPEAAGKITVEQQTLLSQFDQERVNLAQFYPRPAINKRVIRRLLREHLSATLGAQPDDSYTLDAEWRYVQAVGPFVVHTYVDTGGSRHVEYHHEVTIGGVVAIPQASLFRWLGLGPTVWDKISPGAEATAAATVAKFCGAFVSALPTFESVGC